MKRHTRILLSAACAGLLAPAALAATVTPTDPSPNIYDEETYEPIDGGIPYSWTILMGGKDSASAEGVVGAWSWDEDSFPETAKGWTHTSNWVALEITSPSRVTIRLTREAGIVDPFASIPGTLAGDNLYPSFTVYFGWDGTGGDNHTYNNRGDIDWAESVTYATHVENEDRAVVELTLDFPAGRYSIALGGNSPSELAEGRQGYRVTFTSTSLLPDPSISIRGGKTIKISKSRITLTGKIRNAGSLDRVQYKAGSRTGTAKIRGNSWVSPLKLKDGRNVVRIWAIKNDGTRSKPTKIVIFKK